MAKTFEPYLGTEWYNLMKDFVDSDSFKRSMYKIKEDRDNHTVFPKIGSKNFMRAFRELSPEKVKVVIIGQDIYDSGAFDGLAFSNKYNKTISPSLRNIFKELEREYGVLRTNKNLQDWADQGVLLINIAHTVIKNNPGSHLYLWYPFTAELIKRFSNQYEGVVWLLWGRQSQALAKYISLLNTSLQCSHPSPLGFKKTNNPFWGSNIFINANKALMEIGGDTIQWI